MIDPKLVETWDIVFALTHKGCGKFATYEATVGVPRPCTGGSSPYWVLSSPCPDGCTSSPPSELPTNPPCDPNYPDNGTENDIIGCCEGIVQVECTGTCCLCGEAACEPSETCCDHVCVDLQTDHDHCNSCTIACGPDQECCGGECKNIYEDSNNCNGCGIVCTEATPTCCNGECCTTSGCCFVDDILTCIDVTNNHDHCGTCNNKCENDETCCNEECVLTISFQTDPTNCGGCSITCEPSETCCSGSCIDVMGSDTSNCGSCGRACQFGEICLNGACKDPCAANDCSWTWDDKDWGCCKTFVNNGEHFATTHDVTCNTTVLQPHVFDHYTFSPIPCTDLGILPSFMTDPLQFPPIDFNFVITENIAALWRAGDIEGFRAANTAAAPAGYVFNSGDFASSGTYALYSDAPVSISYYANWFATDPSNPITNLNSSATYAGMVGPPAVWIATATCPQGCNCPENAPTANGTTNGQVISHECVNCFPPCDPANELCCDGVCKNIDADTSNCGACGIACEPPGVSDADGEICCNGDCCGSSSSERDNRCCTEGGNPTCANVTNDPNHCGECQNFCGNEQVCCNGECADFCCEPPCPVDQTCCSGICKSLQTNIENCGACDHECAFDPALNIQCCNGVCKPLNISSENCGACGNQCGTAFGETCCNGNCCPAGHGCCNGYCVNLNSDNSNCGSCGYTCTGGYSCVNGTCRACDPPCLTAGTACCHNSCIDIWSDNNNCGACGVFCAGTCCGGVCKNTQMDMYNCGACGIECPQGINTFNLWQCCSGVCRNLKSDSDNCGACGAVCPEPPGDTFTVPKCQLGHCVEPNCECQGYEAGMPPTPEPHDVAFPAECVGNTQTCDGPCYFDAVGGAWVLHDNGGPAFTGSCGQEPDYTYCADDKLSCVDDKLACVGDIYYCVNNIEGQDMPTYCIPKASFDPENQALIGSYIGAENCAAGCSGDGSTCTPACGSGKTCCSSTCVDLQTDINNCGACGTKCASGETCKDGACAGCNPPCASGKSCCEGGTICCEICCEDVCCPSGESCVEGVCATCTPPCTAGQTCCGGSCCPAGRICCDQKCCAAGEFCENGKCATCNPVCYPDETCCDGTCVKNKCGDCPNSCPDGIVCCDEVCTELGTDTNCTGCGVACGEGTKCCNNSCVSVTTTSNCGSCGVTCSAGQACCEGTCTTTGTDTDCSGCGDACTGGTCCDGVCKATQTDNENCGACDNVCDTAASEKCVDGTCVTCDPPCTGLDVCCDLTCCKVCCNNICCASGKVCDNGVCKGCEPECLEPGSTCCASAGPAGSEPEPDQVGACCPAGVVCCNGNCCGDGTGPASMYCCDNSTCCYEGITCCDGKCCAAGQICENGLCADCNPVCFSDEKCCPNADGSGTCIRWQCGDCPNACTRFQTCTNNVCCNTVTTGPLAGQVGVGCGTVCCDPGIVCCRDICCLDPEEECCDGFCVKTDTNQHCGSCNSPCVFPETCCNGVCRSDFSDSDNCGGCEFACPDQMLCCPNPIPNSSTSVVCVGNDFLNCGSCGNRCAEGQSCCLTVEGYICINGSC